MSLSWECERTLKLSHHTLQISHTGHITNENINLSHPFVVSPHEWSNQVDETVKLCVYLEREINDTWRTDSTHDTLINSLIYSQFLCLVYKTVLCINKERNPDFCCFVLNVETTDVTFVKSFFKEAHLKLRKMILFWCFSILDCIDMFFRKLYMAEKITMKQPTSWQPIYRIKWHHDVILRRDIVTFDFVYRKFERQWVKNAYAHCKFGLLTELLSIVIIDFDKRNVFIVTSWWL